MLGSSPVVIAKTFFAHYPGRCAFCSKRVERGDMLTRLRTPYKEHRFAHLCCAREKLSENAEAFSQYIVIGAQEKRKIKGVL